jgi:hypothetical protein
VIEPSTKRRCGPSDECALGRAELWPPRAQPRQAVSGAIERLGGMHERRPPDRLLSRGDGEADVGKLLQLRVHPPAR